MIDFIKCYIGCTIFLLTFYIFGIILFKEKRSKRKIFNIIVFIITSILYSLTVFLLEGTSKTFLSCLLFMEMYKILFKIEYGKALLISIIFAVLTLLLDLATIGIATKILNISKEYYYANIVGSIFGNTIISIETIIITLIIRKVFRKIMSYNISTSKKIIIVSILTILFITYFFYKFASGYKLNKNIIIYLFAIFFFIIILFVLLKQKIENEAILKKYDDLISIMKNYENDIEEQRMLIHETRNELMTIKCKINDKERENEIIKYIDSILGDKTSAKMSKYSKFKYLPSNGIKGFFYYKFTEAEKRNIKVSVNISKKIETSFLGELDTKNFKDLVRLIGVYLDNAIDASAESKNKEIGIEIYPINEDIEIIISNTFDNKINLEKIGIEKITTKGKNHGHGLLLVKHILHNNKNLETINDIKNNLYMQKIKIKKGK